ncbi:MAG TPA: class I adenylate-forming enzyme family protein [Acidimicrobiales bacterium]|nr:class I adenylate-forming enzyme family protein [Acidimicrobiales bacterium]
MNYQEVCAALTAPGERFETVETETRHGTRVTVHKNAPNSLREIFATAYERGDDIFLVYEDERWSFAEVMRHVDALAALLVDHYGVKKGDRIAIGMRNYPEWVLSFAAITSVGGISVSLNAWWTEDELDFAMEDSGATVLIADAERVERSRAAADRLGFRTLAVRTPDGGGTRDGVDRWEDVLPIGAPMPDVVIDPDDDATILYTSGTTGRPKGAVSTHRAIVQALMGFGCKTAVERVRRPEAAPPTDKPAFILIVPLFHVTGCVPVMLSCFSSGLKLVIMYKWDADRALQLIERERVTNFVGVPTQSWDLLESPKFAEYDTSSLVSVGGGGAPAPPELVRRVSTSFAKAAPGIGYGMTETNAYGPQNSGPDYIAHPTSTGRATPILRIEVRDEAGNAVATGERGEIWFKGPNLIRGYWNRPEATAETIVDGWLRSGDIGRLDEEGFVYVEDRAKDMVLRAGENIYCAEVEAALYEHPGVYEAAVFGVPHERLGEEVAAVVYPRPGHDVTAVALQAHVAERLAAFKVPSIVTLYDTQLPRNPAGKILKRELREELLSS